jgi:carboxypeptidase C (cathepsin A)
MTVNPALKLFVAAGTYDLATPYFAAEYTLEHLRLDPELRENVRIERYQAGHMMYVHEGELARLAGHVEAFYGDR